MSVIEEIKAKINIVDLINESVPLRKSGSTYSGYCPFHENKRSPAFTVWPESGTWHCFGACNEGGDIFKFLMKKEGIDFKEARKRLAARAGIRLEARRSEREKNEEARLQRLREALEKAIRFYQKALTEAPGGKKALRYLTTKRNLSEDTLRAFDLGYAPKSMDALLKYMTAKGFGEKELFDAGLVSQSAESGRFYDRFRNRIMIPIWDEEGRPVGFGARALEEADQPKFLNSPQTPLFDKSRTLYGIHAARKAIAKKGEAVLVEGYLDVIALHQAGYKNAVSPMGTALTAPQIQIIKKAAPRIVLALDPDLAGQKAIVRAIETARGEMDRSEELTFDARGLMQRESRLQADIRIAVLPEGQDPDEIVAGNPEEWGELITAARPIVSHMIETMAAQHDIDDPKAAARVAEQILPLIAEVANPVEREKYRQELAVRLKISERALVLPASPQNKKTAPPAAPAVLPQSSPDRALEKQIASILFARPAALFIANRQLLAAGADAIAPGDFAHEPYRMVYQAVQDAYAQSELPPKDYLAASLDEEIRLLLAPPAGATGENGLIAELVRLTAARRRAQLTARLAQAALLLGEEDADEERLKRQIAEYTRAVGRLDRLRAPKYGPARRAQPA